MVRAERASHSTPGKIRCVVAGTTGLGKQRIMQRLREDFRSHFPHSKVGTYSADPANAAAMFGVNWHYAQTVWRTAFGNAIQRWKDDAPDYAFLSMHLSYQVRGRFFSPFSWVWHRQDDGNKKEVTLVERLFKEFQPTHFITLIDDIAAQQDEISQYYHFRLRDLLVWRDIETMLSDRLAEETVRPAYRYTKNPDFPFEYSPIVSVRHPLGTVRRFLTEPKTLRLYVSYPVGSTRFYKDHVQEIRRFIDKLHSHFIVFDPMTIDDRAITTRFEADVRQVMAEKQNTSGPPLSDGPPLSELSLWEILQLYHERLDVCPLRDLTFDLLAHDQWPLPAEETLSGRPRRDILGLSGLEVEEVAAPQSEDIKSIIDYHIETRDLRLIDQVDCVVFYRPLFYGKPDFSHGVMGEWSFARERNRHRILVHDPEYDGAGLAQAWRPDFSEIPESYRFDRLGNLSDPQIAQKLVRHLIETLEQATPALTAWRLKMHR